MCSLLIPLYLTHGAEALKGICRKYYALFTPHILVCVYTYVFFPLLQKMCFCWKPISPRVCWCSESSRPQGRTDGRTDGGEANRNITSAVMLTTDGRGCACYTETSRVMLQNGFLAMMNRHFTAASRCLQHMVLVWTLTHAAAVYHAKKI